MTPALLGIQIDYGSAPRNKPFVPVRMRLTCKGPAGTRWVKWANSHVNLELKGHAGTHERKPGERIVKIQILEWRLKD